MSFSQMSDCKVLDMVAQNMIVLKKEFSQLQGAYEAQHDQIALLRAELEEHCDQSRNQHIFYSNQIQGAAASIQAVQDQLLHQSSSRSTVPPPPPPPSGTATSINPPPASTSSNSDLKFAKPNKFSGKKEDALNFIIACQAYIRAKGATQSHEEKILWITSYLREQQKIGGEAVPLLENIDAFWAEFTKHYVDTNCNEKYCQKWNNLRQKALVQEYTCEFQQYSVSLGYSNETLRNKYYDGLKNDIKDIMLSTMFQWRRATAQQVYDKAEEIAITLNPLGYPIPLPLPLGLLPPLFPLPLPIPLLRCYGLEYYSKEWQRYDEGSNSWEPIDNVANAKEAKEEFHKEYPDAVGA
ncbi:Retrotransposon gag protein [Rhizoctonia solani]|uniref:Retrotransposon gag protein n=1 Tax=Rhizoctonia solani TaxID=456999 RepID=A0A8H8SVV2_9AGAM|nr:Retrotransposon gag protein [Rhizoctonia solani]QRW20366.1 Retrotransposon gag protein [Rhizoctonia solani]